jgi:caa(3)-type oxidase subunit IV
MESSPTADPSTSAPVHGSLRESLVVFVVLGILVLFELGIVKMPGIPRGPAMVALIALAISKALLIGFFFMHLRSETRALKLTVLSPFLFPALYALVLVGDAAWRMLR